MHYVNELKIHTPNYWQTLPDGQQTVPMSDLFALVLVAFRVHASAVVDFFADSQITANTYYKGFHRANMLILLIFEFSGFNLLKLKTYCSECTVHSS